MAHNLHNTLKEFDSGSGKAKFYSLPQLGDALKVKLQRLPVSIRLVLESVLRNYDGKKISEEHIAQLANWKPNAARVDEIPFVVARINPIRFSTSTEFDFDDVMARMQKNAAKFNVERIRQEDIVRAGGGPADEAE